MKVEIYDNTKIEDKVLRLSLRAFGDSVNLVAVNSDGETLSGGYLLRISEAGELMLKSKINENIGLRLNSFGKLLVVDE